MYEFISPVQLVEVLDRGIANRERVLFRVRETVNLAPFLVITAYQIVPGTAYPIDYGLFWFGNEQVDAGYTIFLYTGPGQRRLTTVSGTGSPALVLHWGKQYTIFHDAKIVPVLLHMDHVDLGKVRAIPQTTGSSLMRG